MKINELTEQAHYNALIKGFHDSPREVGTSLMLIVSELSEALEAHRKNDWIAVKEEIADTFIRLGDFCGEYKINAEDEILAKMKINASRPKKHGKEY